MRRFSPILAPLSSRLTAVAAACVVTVCASTALAAEPAAPAPAPATTTTEVTAPTPSVVVVNTTVPAAAPAPVAAPAPAPAPNPTWIVPVEPAPAPSINIPSHISVDVHPHPVAPPSPAEQARARKMSELSRARGLMIGGLSTLITSYGFTALVGTIAIDTAGSRRMRSYGSWMTVPVAGPFAAAFNTRTATGALLTTTLGITQAAGLTMALVGMNRHRRLKRELSLAALPTHGGGHVAMTMRF
ncbi:hypothetical protein [Paraliomyxa miuraensis]|uniref:hypothetical protein n=1 Tax=Paraliomyxa miuraensis TaxID=376150 RepID=UPI00224D3264|nr:hypothetical protein [Paraliomyxa miuraensis]MCX4246510.1 hypothetical protein [Paraliomyxa miuraensis]